MLSEFLRFQIGKKEMLSEFFTKLIVKTANGYDRNWLKAKTKIDAYFWNQIRYLAHRIQQPIPKL